MHHFAFGLCAPTYRDPECESASCLQSKRPQPGRCTPHREIAMKPSVPAPRNLHSIRSALGLPLGIGMLAVLSACTGVSAVTKERVAKGENTVQQAQQTLGQSEHGAMELQQARDKIAAAKDALAKGHHEEAERSAAQAHLYAELAVAKSQ